jgi:hypothetical protein
VAATAAAATSKALVVPTDAAVGRFFVPMNVSSFLHCSTPRIAAMDSAWHPP